MLQVTLQKTRERCTELEEERAEETATRAEETAMLARAKERDEEILRTPTELDAVVNKRVHEAEALVVAKWQRVAREQEEQYERQLRFRDEENAAEFRGALDAAAGMRLELCPHPTPFTIPTQCRCHWRSRSRRSGSCSRNKSDPGCAPRLWRKRCRICSKS
jgi:hypothetical protein